MDLSYWLLNLLWAAIGGFLGTLIALWVSTYQEAHFVIEAADKWNADITYSPPNWQAGHRWKFFRVQVQNRPVIGPLRWLIHRATAEQVSARVVCTDVGWSMRGRWSGTLELPNASPFDLWRLANFPEPTTIAAGSGEILDVFVKAQGDAGAYGWNNEGYLHQWRPPHYPLAPGTHTIEVEVTALNGSHKRQKLVATVRAGVDECRLERPR